MLWVKAVATSPIWYLHRAVHKNCILNYKFQVNMAWVY